MNNQEMLSAERGADSLDRLVRRLRARASFVREWIEDGRIDRPEGFRLEMDAYLGRDSGPVRWLSPND